MQSISDYNLLVNKRVTSVAWQRHDVVKAMSQRCASFATLLTRLLAILLEEAEERREGRPLSRLSQGV